MSPIPIGILAASGGVSVDYQLITEISNATGSVHSFTGIPQTYKHLFVDISVEKPGGSSTGPQFKINNRTSYANRSFGLRVGSVFSENQATSSTTNGLVNIRGGVNTTDVLSWQMYLPFYSDTASELSAFSHAISTNSTGTIDHAYGISSNFNREGVTSLEFIIPEPTAFNVDIKLFGVK